jgi:hypothetical protein
MISSSLPKHNAPIDGCDATAPALTGHVSINADGVVLNPIIVLKSLQTLGNLEDRQSHCYFAISTNGWISKGL